MSSPKPLLAVLEGTRVDPPPVWLMRQAGRFLPEYRALRAKVRTVLDLAYTPELAAEVTLQPVRRFGFDAAILFSDILVIPDALNQEVGFVEGEGPRLEPLRNPAGLRRLASGVDLGRLAPTFETIARVKTKLPQSCAMLGFCGAPWTVASYMIAGRGTPDLAPARLFAYRYSSAFQQLIERLVEASVEYLSAQFAAGVEAVQIFESFAGAIPKAFLADWSLAPMRRIVEGVRAKVPDAKIIVFAKGSGLAPSVIAERTGANAVGLDWTIDPLGVRAGSFRAELGSARLTAVQGNLDPLALVAGEEALEQGVGRVLAGFRDAPHIFNLG
ncbi:MAG: uroporphyrinogen decarboxylase, partial [Hyphomicrobiales bacterium]|nr:uroporphyrinogen decarboxylase [Hyphomicrobiales bacterium]